MLPGADEVWADLDRSRSHCNHGSYGAVPRAVRLQHDELRSRAAVNPNDWWRFEMPERREAARLAMAKFIGASPDNAVFVPNATTGVNIAMAAVELTEGDEVLVTDHVYGAIWRTATRDADRVGGTVTTVPIDLVDDTAAHVKAFTDATTDATRVAIVDHVASPTGFVLPVKEIVDALRERGVVTIVDAAHCPGSRAVDVEALGADFWTGNFHKWASAFPPCAALAVDEAWRGRTNPLTASWGREDGMPKSFGWIGTDDDTSYLSLEFCLETIGQWGWEQLWQHNNDLAAWGAQVVADAIGVEPSLPENCRGPMGLLPLPQGVATTADDAVEFIGLVSRELGVEITANPWRGNGYLRVSAHAYNDEADYERLAKGLPGLLRR